MKILIAGELGYNNKGALTRAKNYDGKRPHIEYYADCAIMYKPDKTFIVPIQAGGWKAMPLPNPIPYRGVSIGVVDPNDGGGLSTFVIASNGEVLAREVQNQVVVPSVGG